MQTIKIYGEEHPAYQTMGAMKAFKNATGKEVNEIASGGLDDMIDFLFYVVRSACRRERREFRFETVEEFADGVSFEDFTAWSTSLSESVEKAGKTTGK